MGLTRWITQCLISISAFIYSCTTLAGGLAVPEQSASAAARGLAGAAAVADDASTVFYNPAGMTRLSKNEVLVALGTNFPRTTFENASGLDVSGGTLGGISTVPDRTLYVPSVYMVWALSRNTRVGLGLNSPFGQDVRYDEGWIGRYFVTSTHLRTLNLSGTVAWRISPAVSIGGGIDYQSAEVRRRAAIDFGSVCFGVLGPGACSGLGLLPQAQDGHIELNAKSEKLGYNLGLFLEPKDGLRMGVAYRSKFRHNFSGTADFAVPPAAAFLTLGGAFRPTAGSSKITLPESVSVGVAADLSPRFTILAGLIWSRSSRFSQLVIRFDNPSQATLVEAQNWKDTYRASIGFDYHFKAEKLLMHAGLAFDESPIPAQFRYPYLPDADRISLNTGLTWRPTPEISLTMSYAYARYMDAPVSQALVGVGTLSGVFKREFNSLGLQAGFRF